MAYTQDNRLIRIATPLGGDELLITGFRGHEEISRLFSFELSLLSHNHSIAFKSIIGGNVTVSIQMEDDKERFFNGIVSSFSQTGGWWSEGNSENFSMYTATIVPWMWLLTKTADLRIFQEKSAVDIIEQIFTEKGISDFTKKLNKTYPPRTYCVQYRESDFDFISRLMEEEGISYYFSHENGKHTLVLADATNAYSPCLHQDEVRYQVSGAGEKAEESMIKTLEIKNEIRVGKYSLNDYNFETPSTKLLVEMEGKHNQGPVKKGVYDYPGRYAKRAEGEGYATVHIQEEEARVTSITGSSDVKSFASGYSFTLVDYFRNEMNNKKYLLTAVDHVAEQQGLCSSCGDDSYTNSFTCIPLDTIFRPLRLTPKPVVEGVQTAFVVGPAGEEIYTDDHGRIKVQFHWDRLGKVNENSSCWMRVGQIWAGPGWGAMYIPRVGHEVIVDFLEGDPDRPIVIGSVYHGTNQPPYQLPAEKTKTTIKSSSSKGGGGFNEIRFEDKKDSEQLFVHAQKNFDLQVKNDRFETIGNDRHLHVTKNKMEHVENNRHEKVVNDHLEEIGKDRHLSVKGKEAKKVTQTLSLTVEGDVAEVFKANHSEQTTTDYYLKATNIVIEATTNVTVKVGQSYIAIEASGIKIGTTGQIVLEATNTVGIKGTAGVTVESPAQATLKSANTTVKGDAMVTVDGGAMTKVKGGMVMIN